MGFFDRNRENVTKMGYDDSRLPPGQYLTERFPVLHVGDVPTYAPGEWDLKIFGEVHSPFTLSFEELTALPAVTLTTDIHCVTKWSKFDTTWEGVSFDDILADAGISAPTGYLLAESHDDYTTNVPVADLVGGRALVATRYEGQPIHPDHGGPARLFVPHLYFWKSAKWVKGLRFTQTDTAGFWELRGYHMHGDPWREQRFTGD